MRGPNSTLCPTALLNELGDLLHGYVWRDIVDGSVEVTLESIDVPVRLIELIDKGDLLITNELFSNSPALQVVWPDEYDRYPWMEDYALLPKHQLVRGVLPLGQNQARGPRVIAPTSGRNRAQRRKAARRRSR